MTEAAIEDPDDRALANTVSAAALRAIDPAKEDNAGVRAVGHRAIELLGVKEATDEVTTLLVGDAAGVGQDPSHWVRGAAVSALGALGGPEALVALRQALIHDSSQDVRAAAARELGELEDGSSQTTETLIEALRDEAGVVRLNARRALRQIHGADLGLDPRTWRGWFLARGVAPALEPDELPPQGDEAEARPEEAPMQEAVEQEPPLDDAPFDAEHPAVEPHPEREDDRR